MHWSFVSPRILVLIRSLSLKDWHKTYTLNNNWSNKIMLGQPYFSCSATRFTIQELLWIGRLKKRKTKQTSKQKNSNLAQISWLIERRTWCDAACSKYIKKVLQRWQHADNWSPWAVAYVGTEMYASKKCVRNRCNLVTKEDLHFAISSPPVWLVSLYCFCLCSGSEFVGREGIPTAWKCRGVDVARGGTPELAVVSATRR